MGRIPLTMGLFAIVDDADFEALNIYRWRALLDRDTHSYYAVREMQVNGRQTTIRMHRQIMDAQTGEFVDHRHHDTLNNQRENLRKCTRAQNMANQRKTHGNSLYKGVCWDKARQKWLAGIRHNGHRINLGRHTKQEDAAVAYDNKARELFGEFALLNFA